ncbi:MAG: hypothetical protein AAF533_03280, partial [Acidobacteriota bacterium]
LTYFGNADYDEITDIALDAEGNVLIGLTTLSALLPTTDAIQAEPSGGFDLYLARLDPSLTTLLQATYLGGTNNDYLTDLELGPDGSIFLRGVTRSTDFPTENPLQGDLAGDHDDFIVRLSSDGSSIVYSTYLGGSGSEGRSAGLLEPIEGQLAIAPDGSAWLTGWTGSHDFPTVAPLQSEHGGGEADCHVMQLSADGTELLFSTFLGGDSNDRCHDIALDADGAIHLLGVTSSRNPSLLNPDGIGGDGYPGSVSYLARLSPGGAGLDNLFRHHDVASSDGSPPSVTILKHLLVDSRGAAHAAGFTWRADVPLAHPVQDELNLGVNDSATDALVMTLSPDGDTVELSTYLGGGTGMSPSAPWGDDYALDIALDAGGRLLVTGETHSLDFPTVEPIQPDYDTSGSIPFPWSSDAFILRIGGLDIPTLRVRPGVSNNLDMGWDETNGDPRFGIYRGTLESLVRRHAYDHALVTDCHLRTNATVPIAEESSYFLLARFEQDGRQDFGVDSRGRRRGGPDTPCP